MEFLDRKRFHETWTDLWREGRLAVGLVKIARHLGEKLVVADPGGRIQSCRRLDLGADFERDLRGDFYTL